MPDKESPLICPICDSEFQGSGVIYQCQCGLQRLNETICKPDAWYETGEYRQTIPFDHTLTVNYLSERLAMFKNIDVRGLRILDIGSGEGYFLDVMKALGAETAQWEIGPNPQRHPSPEGTYDFVTCFDVIEHVEDIKALMAKIRTGRYYVISTPVKKPETQGIFFYRPQHRWIFNDLSLTRLVEPDKVLKLLSFEHENEHQLYIQCKSIS